MADNSTTEDNRLVNALALLESTIDKIMLKSYKKGQDAAFEELSLEINKLRKENEELKSKLEEHKSASDEIACEISNSIKQLDLLIAARQK